MSNREYWQQRLEKLTSSIQNTQEKDTLRFLSAYKDSRDEIQNYVNMLYAKYSSDNILSLTEMYKFNRYQNMIKEINSIVKELGKQEEKYISSALKSNYTENYMQTGKLLNQAGIKADFNLIPQNRIEKAVNYPWSGNDFSSRVWTNKEKLVKNLSKTITRGFVEGSGISDMSKNLKQTMNSSASDARRLVRTESMHVIAASHHDTYTKAGVKKVEFVTAHDSLVCDECDALDGEIFDLNDAPMIPLHANSRSILVPVIDV